MRFLTEAVGITIVVGLVVVIALIAFFDASIRIGDWEFNPRDDVFSAESSTHLIRQNASERAILLIARNKDTQLPAYSACAEPPPDTAQEIARKLSTSLESVAKKGESLNASLITQITGDLRTTTKALFERSQGIQLLRDTMFRLCEAFQNGVLPPEDYRTLIIKLISTANFIIPLEQCMNITSHETIEGLGKIIESAISQCLQASANFNMAQFSDKLLDIGKDGQFLLDYMDRMMSMPAYGYPGVSSQGGHAIPVGPSK